MFEFIAKPFGILLVMLYRLCGNYGVAVILFAAIVKLILLPVQMKSKRGQLRQQRLQPRVKELEKKYAGDKAKAQAETLKMYKDEGVNPAGGCLWNLIPFFIMIALFQVIRNPLTSMMGVAGEQLELIIAKLAEMGFEPTLSSAYAQVEQVQFITAHFSEFAQLSPNLIPFDFSFLGLNLGLQPVWNYPLIADWSQPGAMQGFYLFLLPIFSAVASLLVMLYQQKKMPVAKDTPGANSILTMLMMGPVISLWFGFSMPAAMSMYILVGSTFLQFIQDFFLTRYYNKVLDAEDAVKNKVRREKAEAEERERKENAAPNASTSKKKQQTAEKQERLQKQLEWEKKNSPPVSEPDEPSRVGNRRYARGRAYDPDRFAAQGVTGAVDNGSDLDEPERLEAPSAPEEAQEIFTDEDTRTD